MERKINFCKKYRKRVVKEVISMEQIKIGKYCSCPGGNNIVKTTIGQMKNKFGPSSRTVKREAYSMLRRRKNEGEA